MRPFKIIYYINILNISKLIPFINLFKFYCSVLIKKDCKKNYKIAICKVNLFTVIKPELIKN